jgi:hypothetical protein
MVDLLGGQVDLMFQTRPEAIQHVRAGKVRALGVTGKRTSAALPGVPTIADAALAGFEVEGWMGIAVPPGTPTSIVGRLNAEANRILADKDARGGSHYMGAGDIDGDGWKEIAVGAKGKPFADGNWFAYWKNPGKDGVKSPWKKILLAANQEAATNILPCDVNGDGKVDWLASRGHGTGLLWFENPSWKIHEIDTEIRQPHSLTAFDHDGDGDTDAASCGYESKWVRWYENDGKGNFTIHTIDDNQESYDLRSVDMDGDGDIDLLNAGRGSGNVVWYENLRTVPAKAADRP